MADKIAVSRGKQYGNTQIQGGQVQLGDAFNTNHFTISKAIVNLPAPLRRKAEQSRARVQHARNRTRGHSRAPHSRSANLRGIQAAQTQPGAYPGDENRDSNQLKPEHAPFSTSIGGHVGAVSRVAASQSTDLQLLSASGYESLLVCAALLSYIIGKQVTVQQVLNLFQQCRQDALFPLLTLLFGFVLHSYFGASIVNTQSPVLPYLILEDCYGLERQVSIDIFSSFTTVKGFLHSHYTQKNGTAGAHLIQRGQFHLQLRSRHGRVLLKKNWASAVALLEHGVRVVNSVYVTVETTTCLSCSRPMVPGANEYHCHDCQKFCRDFHSLEAEQYDHEHETAVREQEEPSRHAHDHHDGHEYPAENDPVYGIRDLQNINLRIVPPKPARMDKHQGEGANDPTARREFVNSQTRSQPIDTIAQRDTMASQESLVTQHQPLNIDGTTNRLPAPGPLIVQKSPSNDRKIRHRARLMPYVQGGPVYRPAVVSNPRQPQSYSPRPQTLQLRSIVEKFVFNLRRYTHAAHCFGHWDPDRATRHLEGRHAARLFASELTAAKSLLDEGKTGLASGHFELARKRLDNPALFDTWYHETPIRLLFEIGRLAYGGQYDLASQLLEEIQKQSRNHLKDQDPRQAVFNDIGDLNVQQLRDLHGLAARIVFYGLEAHYRADTQLLYEVRLNRALDLSWFDPKADLSDWIPRMDQLEHDLGENSPYAIYFLLLEAYRLVATDEHEAAEKAWSTATQKIALLQDAGIEIDKWRVGRGFRRLGQQLRVKEHFKDASQMLRQALRLLEDEKEKNAIMIELCQTQESIARALGDVDDAEIWTQMLLQLEKQS